MSWFSSNYEKAVLALALAMALGLAYLGWSKFGAVTDDFGLALKGVGNNNTAVASADLIPKALQSMRLDRTLSRSHVGERPVDLFTGVPLFIKSSEPEKPVDLFTDAPVHPPIPNLWWLENHLSPGFADSPSRDPDGDGYSNLEEWKAKTDPTNRKSHPALIAKLMYLKDDSLVWAILPKSGTEGAFPFDYTDSKRGKNRVPAGGMIQPGGLFFPKPPMQNRFKLLGSEVRKEMNAATKTEVEVTFVRIEDQKSNKKGTVYLIPAPLNPDRANNFAQYDRTAVLSLKALGMGGKEFKVEENTAFALPPEAAEKVYLLKKVTPNSITVEYPDAQGNRKTVEINKGSLPKLSD
jgi:hypothetical protein